MESTLIKIHELNTRSSRAEDKRAEIFKALTATADLVALNETWLPFELKWLHPELKILQSPGAKHHGVLIATDQLKSNLRPILPDLWDDCLVAGRYHRRKDKEKGIETETACFVIAVYWPPCRHRECLPKVKAVINHCRRLDDKLPIALTGDLNLKAAQVQYIENELNLIRAQGEQQVLPTHFDKFQDKHS